MSRATSPPRGYFQEVVSKEYFKFQYNPDALEEDLDVAYQKTKILGMSHDVLQYQHTGSHKVTFDLAFDAFSFVEYDVDAARKRLLSLCYPKRGAGNIAAGGPPRLLFVWPGFFSMTCVLEKLKFKHKRFAWVGDPNTTWFVCSVTLQEIRDTRLFGDEVLSKGTRR